MPYTIERIDFYVRETRPARFATALGKAGRDEKPEPTTSPLCHVRIAMKNDAGEQSFGCAADRLSVRWLDKRPGREKGPKLRQLVALLEQAGEIYRNDTTFDSPFDKWRWCHDEIVKVGRASDQEDLSSSFASALLERAILDGVCRLASRPLFEMLRSDELGFRPGLVHPELKDVTPQMFRLSVLPERPQTRINIRHTVGLFDPLNDEDWPRDKRLEDGLPETIEDYVRRDGMRYFKVKISGDADADFDRLKRLWEILPQHREPVITLDANEAFEDLETFARFVERLERDQLGLVQHILYIEQPLPRRLAFDQRAEKWIRRVGQIKPVIIDESDDSLDALLRARAIGYAGTSHKNCKGVFKSLLNRTLIARFAESDEHLLLSAEDLQNLPIVPLHQDFVSVGILNLNHCERNGHHYNAGLSMLSPKDLESAARHHRDLYERRGDQWYLKIRDGAVECGSLQCPGFGVRDEPDWESMTDMNRWVRTRYPV